MIITIFVAAPVAVAAAGVADSANGVVLKAVAVAAVEARALRAWGRVQKNTVNTEDNNKQYNNAIETLVGW